MHRCADTAESIREPTYSADEDICPALRSMKLPSYSITDQIRPTVVLRAAVRHFLLPLYRSRRLPLLLKTPFVRQGGGPMVFESERGQWEVADNALAVFGGQCGLTRLGWRAPQCYLALLGPSPLLA